MRLPTRQTFCLVAIALTFASHCLASDSVVIVLDDSGSMNEKMSGGIKRIEAAKNAIKIVLQQFPADTKVGILLLNGDRAKQHWAIPLKHLSVPQATRRVESVVADGSTPLGERMREAAEALLKLREQQIYGTYRLLIVTDGEANDAKLLAQYLPDVLSRGLVVDAIGVDMKQNHSLATRVHSYRRADDAIALSKAVQEVFAEKTEPGTSDAQEDYSLLQAFEDETAKEALLALSKPNNSPIVGFTIPDISPIAPPSGVPTAAPTNSTGSILRTAIATLLNCMFLLVIFVIVVAVLFSKTKRNRR